MFLLQMCYVAHLSSLKSSELMISIAFSFESYFDKNDIFQDIMNLQCLREKHQISRFLIQFSLFINSGNETN